MGSFTPAIIDLLTPVVDSTKGIFLVIRDQAQTYTQPAYQTLKRRAVHILKTLGLLLSLAFAGASLYYAKAAADDAHCQLEIQKKQYCDTAPEDMKQKYPCDEILARGSFGFSVSCCCGGPDTQHWELLFALPFPYYQVYGLTYCQGGLYGGEPWWYDWGRPYDVHFKPILWRFPVAYTIADYFTSPSGSITVLIGCLGVVWANAGDIRMHRSAQTYFLFLVIIVTTLSFCLVAAETQRKVEYWERQNHWFRDSIDLRQALLESAERVIKERSSWHSCREFLLWWLEFVQSVVFSVFDYHKADYPIYVEGRRAIVWEDLLYVLD